MSCISLCLLFLSVAVGTQTCAPGEAYAKVSKKTLNYAHEESYEIYGNGVLLITSPTFANNEMRVIEYCLNATTNNQYTLKLIDEYGDSWSSGAWIMVEGLYGNRAFKAFMSADNNEEYTVSLYYGINKSDSWKMMTESVSGEWTQYFFPESGWSEVTLGSVTTTVSGTQYFRKQFVGLTGMAAYELSMNYRYGIVAYINGAEIYRDNMPDGTPSGSTTATGSYSSVEFRSLIRPGTEVANSQSVLAIEVHFTSAGQTFVDFNAFLALLAPSVGSSETPCFVYPYDTTVSSTYGASSGIFDYGRTSSFTVAATGLPVTVNYDLSGVKAFINGGRVWAYTSPTLSPNAYTLQGSNSPTSSTWTTIVSAQDLIHTSKQFITSVGYFYGNYYSNYRVNIQSSSGGGSVSAYELQPVICSVSAPATIEYSQPTYTCYAVYEAVSIRPILEEFSNCQINPPASNGLTFDSTTCTLSGTPETATSTAYTVTSTMNGVAYTGSFTVTATACTGTFISLLRTYKTSAVSEGFSIIDMSSQQVVYSVSPNSGQTNNQDWTHFLCSTASRLEVITTSTGAYWQSASFLYVRSVLGYGEYDTILRAKYDNNLGLESSYEINIQYAVKNNEEWKYKMGEVPANWYSGDVATWNSGTAIPGFGASTNQIQLYRKTFTVGSLDNMAGVVISLKYQYGVIIYLNGHEAFRLGVTGDLSTSSLATTSLSSVKWRQVSLPIKTISIDGVAAVDYIVSGSNTIGIALVAQQASQTTASFDCAVRLMGSENESRVYDLSVTHDGISGNPLYLMDFYCSYSISGSSCSDNYYQITFNNDRHEWISSVTIQLYYTQGDQQPRQFVLKARNGNDEWTTLKTVTGMTWSLLGQKVRIWITNNKSYNMYRFENFGTGDESSCSWKIGMIDLRSDATTVNIPALSYESTIEIYKDIEMGEAYPNSNYYTDFTVNPPLPTGVNLDPNTGTISGTATGISTAAYMVSAKKFTGETVTAQLSLTVEICTGGRSLITGVARIDLWPAETSYKLYQGKGTTGTIISEGGFTLASNLNYVDSCLQHGIYTFEFDDTLADGWNAPGGYYLSVDVGELKFEMGQVYTGVKPTVVTTIFSSYLPFQVEYDDWKVYKNVDEISSDWNTINFDDSTWTVTKAAQIGTSEAITVYIRRDITLDDVNNYNMLNVRMKYAGGVVCYFNGRKVARFNLEDGFNGQSESIEVHDSNAFSKFHIVLATVGAVTGKNVIAFEIHRPNGQSSAEPIVFDATGVFGVNDCSLGVDSVINVSGTPGTTIGNLENFFDYTPATYGYQPAVAGTYLQWTVENLEGSKFNSFAVESVYARTGWGFSLYGREQPSDNEHDPEAEEYLSMFAQTGLSVPQRGRAAWEVPVGIAGFRQFRHEVDVPTTSTVTLSAYILQYCKASSTGGCPAVDDYPAVGEDQISPGSCEYGYRGYSYRKCENGQLGSIQTDKCSYRVPSKLVYKEERMVVVIDTQTNIPAPSYNYIITKFYLAENTALPDGLTLDTVTGAITGIATSESSLKTYTIYGENPAGAVSTVITMAVRKGECKVDGLFPKTTVGEVAVYDCAMQGSYIGTQKRACILGDKDGKWEKIQGICMPVFLIIVLVIIVIVIIAVVVFFLTRTTKKAKAVGGVKGKKVAAKKVTAKASKPATSKTKNVKV